MTVSVKASRAIDSIVQASIDRQLQINDRTTALTDKVVVRSDIGIEAIKSAPKIDLLYQSLLDQDAEITIHRTHAQIGELVPQLIVEPVGGGMSSRTLQ